MRGIKRSAELLRPYFLRSVFAFFLLVAANAAMLFMPWVLKIVVDNVIPAGDSKLLISVSFILAAAFVLKFICGWFAEVNFSFIGENIIRDLRSCLICKIYDLSVPFSRTISSGGLVSRVIGDVESIRTFIFGGAVDFVYSFLTFICILGLLFYVDAPLAGAALCYVPLCFWLYIKRSPELKKLNHILRGRIEELSSRIADSFSGIKVVAGYGCARQEEEKFSTLQSRLFSDHMKSHKLGFLLWMGAEFTSGIGLVLIIYSGVRRVFDGYISAGELVAFYTYTGMMLAPVIRMALVNNYYQEASAAFERIDALLARQPLVSSDVNARDPGELKENIVFEDVSFAYEDDKEILSNISFSIEKGKVYAFVGKSGSGKTTLLNLLLRFFDPSTGRILVDGQDLKGLDLEKYRSRTALVMQDDYIFSATVRENLLFAKPDASEEEMRTAARAAHAEEFILDLACGYDTLIGSGGVGLSSGQIQRLSIARALLRDPQLLILDEATSNIDSYTERSIVEDAFKEMMRGRTVIIVAHRLSSIEHVDRIFVLSDGRLIDSGSHNELIKRPGWYRKFREKQMV